MNSPLDELALEAGPDDGGCGCGDPLAAPAGDAVMPSPEEMEAALDGLLGAGDDGNSELELAATDELLFGGDDLERLEAGGAGEIELRDLVALAEEHPGLRISISFA